MEAGHFESCLAYGEHIINGSDYYYSRDLGFLWGPWNKGSAGGGGVHVLMGEESQKKGASCL